MTTISPAYGAKAAQPLPSSSAATGPGTCMPSSGMPMTGLKAAMPQQGGQDLNNVVKGPFGQLPSTAGSNDTAGGSGQGNDQLKVLGDLYKETMKKAGETQDPKLKAHFQAEAQVLKSVLDKLGGASAGQGGPQASAPQQAPQAGNPQPSGAGTDAGSKGQQGSPTGGAPSAAQPDSGTQGRQGQGSGGSVDQVKQAFASLYQETMQKAAQSQDPQTRQHYQAEAQVIKSTLDALTAGGAGSQAGPQAAGDPNAAGAPAQVSTDTSA